MGEFLLKCVGIEHCSVKLGGELFSYRAEDKVSSVDVGNVAQSHAKQFFGPTIALIGKNIELAAKYHDWYH